MKNLLLIFIFLAFSCTHKSKQNALTENSNSTKSKINEFKLRIEAAKSFEFKNPDRPVEDTLILKTRKGIFEISPSGLFRNNRNDTIQLKTKLIVEEAFLYEDSNHFYLFYTDTDYEGSTSWIEKISKEPLDIIYSEQIQGFNLGQPIINKNFVYVTTIGFIGKIDLNTGKYDWKHYNLYDREKCSFNSFDTIMLKENTTEFLSENYKSKKLDKIIIDNLTGKIKQIEK
jgi:hypothetical protein